MPAQRAVNNTVVRSVPAAAAAVGLDCTVVTLWDAASAGDWQFEAAISTNPDALALGERYEIASGGLAITQTPGTGESDDSAQRALAGRVDGGLWLQYHSGAAGAQRNENVIPIARTEIPEAAWTIEPVPST